MPIALYNNEKLDTGRYTPECLTEREQVKHVSTLVIAENKNTYVSDETKASHVRTNVPRYRVRHKYGNQGLIERYKFN